MSFTSFGVNAGADTEVITIVSGVLRPILVLATGHANIQVTVEQAASPEEAEAFARALVEAAQRFLDATVENNARQAVPA